MKRRLSLLVGSTALAAFLSLAVTANAPAAHNRGNAICSPLESPDPPGCSATGPCAVYKCMFNPYYSPIIPIACRWRTTCLTPYYPCYCPWFHHAGPCVCTCPGLGFGPVGSFGGYTGTPQDEEVLLHLGGAGLSGHGPILPAADPDKKETSEGSRGTDGTSRPKYDR